MKKITQVSPADLTISSRLSWMKQLFFRIPFISSELHTYLVTDNRLRLRIVQRRHSKPPFVLRIDIKINLPEMLKALMMGIRPRILARQVFLSGCKPPSQISQMPMDGCEGDYVLQPLELPGDQGPVGYIDEATKFLANQWVILGLQLTKQAACKTKTKTNVEGEH